MEMQTAQELIPRRLKGENFTCAGCRYRVLAGISSKGRSNTYVWTENCLKKQKPPADHSQIGVLTSISPSFKTPCTFFYGAIETSGLIFVTRRQITHPAIPEDMHCEIVVLNEEKTIKIIGRTLKKLGGQYVPS
jgi:hypothetical protein